MKKRKEAPEWQKELRWSARLFPEGDAAARKTVRYWIGQVDKRDKVLFRQRRELIRLRAKVKQLTEPFWKG